MNQTLDITLGLGMSFKLEFTGRNEVTWRSGNEGGKDWCESVEVAAHTYFIDMTFTQLPRESQTFIVNTHPRQVLGIRTNLREGDVGKEPMIRVLGKSPEEVVNKVLKVARQK